MIAKVKLECLKIAYEKLVNTSSLEDILKEANKLAYYIIGDLAEIYYKTGKDKETLMTSHGTKLNLPFSKNEKKFDFVPELVVRNYMDVPQEDNLANHF